MDGQWQAHGTDSPGAPWVKLAYCRQSLRVLSTSYPQSHSKSCSTYLEVGVESSAAARDEDTQGYDSGRVTPDRIIVAAGFTVVC